MGNRIVQYGERILERLKHTYCIVMAAGKSTRFLPGRNKLKEKILGWTPLEWVLHGLSEAGFRHILIVTRPGEGYENLEASINGLEMQRVFQDPPKGTGHAVLQCREALQNYRGDVLVINGDTPGLQPDTLRRMLIFHHKSRAWLTLTTGIISHIGAYGAVIRSRGRIVAIQEAVARKRSETPHPAEANLGVYALKWPEVFPFLEELPVRPEKGEIFLTDLVSSLVKAGKKVVNYRLEDASEALGINTWEELHEVQEVIRQQVVARWVSQGVHILAPSRVIIEPTVKLSPGVILYPDVFLESDTEIGKDSIVYPGVRLAGCRVGERVKIYDHSILERCIIGNDCEIGPMARLRPETILNDRVRVGNFVEIKKSNIGKDSKALHLTYLGDAVIGERVNVGAGTITCNYDGETKHTTVIEDEVFIGSDSQLIAPVRIGRRAYVGAGTTVTHDVQEESLALSRPPLVEHAGWVRKRKTRKRQFSDESLTSKTHKL